MYRLRIFLIVFLVLSLITVTFVASAEGLNANKTWGNPVKIGNSPGREPHISVDSSGNIYAIWCDYNHIYLNYCSAGSSWSSNYTKIDDHNNGDAGSPDIAISKSGNVYAVWTGNDHGIYFSHRPKGQNWSNSIRLDDNKEGYNNFPQIAVDDKENLYVVFSANGTYFFYKPAGNKWSGGVKISSAQAFDIKVDHNRNAYAAFYEGTKLKYSYRPAGGQWSKTFLIDDKINSSRVFQRPGFAVDPSGNLHAIWGGYYSHGSTGKTWTPKIKLGEKAGSPSSVTVDSSGNVYAVWCEFFKSNNLFESKNVIYFSCRPKGGKWSSKVKISDIPVGESTIDIAVSPSGEVYVIWISQSSDIYVISGK